MTSVVSLVFIIVTVFTVTTAESYLNIHVFPVEEGDATIIECHDDTTSGVALTLVNAGTNSLKKSEIQAEYFKFLQTKLNSPDYYIKAIFLTSPDKKHYNFIHPLIAFVKDKDILNTEIYVGGQRSSYVYSHIRGFPLMNKVYEFTRKQELNGKVSSCGHYAENDENIFYQCVKRNVIGPIPKSDGIVDICKTFQITVMAANYGLHQKGKDLKEENSLVLKVTPSGQAIPSILIGDFENDREDGEVSENHYNYLKQAHNYYVMSQRFPSLADGLSSTVLLIPQNGGRTNANEDELFYSDYVKPTYVIVSADIRDSRGHPRCLVLHIANIYMMKFSARYKTYQCHSGKPKDEGDIEISEGSDNLYQTTIIDPEHFPYGHLQLNLITFTMNRRKVTKPVTHQIIPQK